MKFAVSALLLLLVAGAAAQDAPEVRDSPDRRVAGPCLPPPPRAAADAPSPPGSRHCSHTLPSPASPPPLASVRHRAGRPARQADRRGVALGGSRGQRRRLHRRGGRPPHQAGPGARGSHCCPWSSFESRKAAGVSRAAAGGERGSRWGQPKAARARRGRPLLAEPLPSAAPAPLRVWAQAEEAVAANAAAMRELEAKLSAAPAAADVEAERQQLQAGAGCVSSCC